MRASFRTVVLLEGAVRLKENSSYIKLNCSSWGRIFGKKNQCTTFFFFFFFLFCHFDISSIIFKRSTISPNLNSSHQNNLDWIKSTTCKRKACVFFNLGAEISTIFCICIRPLSQLRSVVSKKNSSWPTAVTPPSVSAPFWFMEMEPSV